MVHSTGANNPNLRRYIAPDDGILGLNTYNNHWNQPYPDGRSVCVHAFIGKLKDGTVATYQTLPWDTKAWHCGGKANSTHIGFEICEGDLNDKTYFGQVYKEAVELCVVLCKLYGILPNNIISHKEGYTKGLASNHGDVDYWFTKHNKTMNTFRSDVELSLNKRNQYIVVSNISGYMTASDAKNRLNRVSTVTPGIYYVYNKYPEGCGTALNVTKDPSGNTPGTWINSLDNVRGGQNGIYITYI